MDALWSQWLYRGIIAREAKNRGLNPIIAGRNQDKIAALAQELGLEWRSFDLLNQEQVVKYLADVHLVLNCAGPFSATSESMINACIHSQTHYLDITGEIAVFDYAQSQHLKAEAANILLCPGVGFDVIPTDCLAATLKQALPDANYLALGFDSNATLSPGTAKTAIESMALGGKARINGEITSVPFVWKTRTINFGRGEKLATTIPWGDLSTAYYTTEIPNIEVYVPMSPKRLSLLKKINWIRWLLKLRFVQHFLKRKAAEQKGPDAEQLKNLVTYLWGEVSNSRGEQKTATMTTANGYALTITGSLTVVEYLLENSVKGGYKTPSQLMDADFITRLPGSSNITIHTL